MYHLNDRFSLSSATGNVVSILNTFNDLVTVLEIRVKLLLLCYTHLLV